jgi:hypothetical protein
MRLLVFTLLAGAGMNPLLHPQGSATTPAADKRALATRQAVSDPAAVPFNSNAFSVYLGTDLGTGASAFGQSPYPSPIPLRGASPNSLQWNSSNPDSFEPAPNFGYFAGPAGVIRLRRTRDAGGQASGVPRRIGAVGTGESFGDPALVFPAIGSPMSSPRSGAMGPFGPALGTTPSLNQLMRGGFNLPLNTSFGAFQLLGQGRVPQGSNGTGLDFSRMIATGMFTTPDLGNGVRFSAGAGQSIAGSTAGGIIKHSGPTVALKLSF